MSAFQYATPRACVTEGNLLDGRQFAHVQYLYAGAHRTEWVTYGPLTPAELAQLLEDLGFEPF